MNGTIVRSVYNNVMLFCIQSFEASYVSDPKTQGPTRDDLHSKRGVAHRLCDRPFDQHGRGHRASRFRSGASGPACPSHWTVKSSMGGNSLKTVWTVSTSFVLSPSECSTNSIMASGSDKNPL